MAIKFFEIYGIMGTDLLFVPILCSFYYQRKSFGFALEELDHRQRFFWRLRIIFEFAHAPKRFVRSIDQRANQSFSFPLRFTKGVFALSRTIFRTKRHAMSDDWSRCPILKLGLKVAPFFQIFVDLSLRL